MMTRRTLEGALKCALRDFLREEWRAMSSLLVLASVCMLAVRDFSQVLIFVIVVLRSKIRVGLVNSRCASRSVG